MNVAKNEVLKQIPNYSDYYASNLGNIYSMKKGKLKKIKCSNNGHGYCVLNLSKDGKAKQFKVHQLILFAFKGGFPKDKTDIRHLNGIKTDNRLENLKYGTRTENSLDAIKHNGSTRGIKNGMNKINEKFVIIICSIYNTKYFTHKEIAEKFNISRRHVGDIVNKKYWRWFFTEDNINKINIMTNILLEYKTKMDINKKVDEWMNEENLKIEYF